MYAQRTRRVYVKVNSDFDSTGYMQPKSITWSDGRVFPIETVKDFRPAGSFQDGCSADRYTVQVCGEVRHLFFEKMDRFHPSRVGRWYVECVQNQ